jgi:hypothetical protein
MADIPASSYPRGVSLSHSDAQLVLFNCGFRRRFCW